MNLTIFFVTGILWIILTFGMSILETEYNKKEKKKEEVGLYTFLMTVVVVVGVIIFVIEAMFRKPEYKTELITKDYILPFENGKKYKELWVSDEKFYLFRIQTGEEFTKSSRYISIDYNENKNSYYLVYEIKRKYEFFVPIFSYSEKTIKKIEKLEIGRDD